jgi:filamentous hemagglutinin family protein
MKQQLLCLQYAIAISSGVLFAQPTTAQSLITPDASLGVESSIVTRENIGIPSVPIFNQIDGGATRGRNLFHSFQLFNVSRGEAAIFSTNNLAIQNILVRVTGGVSSNIDGEISAIGAPNTNLFLINPSGITFGRNSRVNVGGSFIASTANAIKFGDSGLFSATNPAASSLLNIQPSALFFASGQPTRLEMRPGSQIIVPNDRSIGLIGGDIIMNQGTLTAPAGKIDLIGVRTSGDISLGFQNRLLTFNLSGIKDFADINIINQSLVDTSSLRGGDIVVTGNNISISSSVLSGDTILGGNGRFARSQAGDIKLNATQKTTVSNGSQIINQQRFFGENPYIGGGIFVKTGDFTLEQSNISVSNGGGNGDTGKIEIEAVNALRIDNLSRIVNQIVGPNLRSVGNAGNTTLTGRTIYIGNGARVTSGTGGRGNAGNITLQGLEAIDIDGVGIDSNSSGIFSQINQGGVGDGGTISLAAPQISLTGGGLVSSRIAGGRGNAGTIFFKAPRLLRIVGIGKNDKPSALSSVIERDGVGNGGEINVNAKAILLDQAQILSENRGVGNAGSIAIDANTFSAINGVVISSGTDGIGNAGAMIFNTENISLDNAIIASESRGAGRAGVIDINTAAFSGANKTTISSSAKFSGDAENININVTGDALLKQNSAIKTAVENGAIGNGGNINFTANTLTIASQAFLSAESTGIENAGAISLRLGDRLILRDANIRTFSTLSSGGNISIDSGRGIVLRNSDVVSAVLGQGNKGGAIDLTAGAIVAFGDSDILAFAKGGTGGNITFRAKVFLAPSYTKTAVDIDPFSLDGNNRVDINATGAVSGIITLPTLNPLQNNRPELPNTLVDPSNQLSRSCIARNPQTGKFYITGAGGIPPQPGEPTPSSYSTLPVQSAPQQIVEADGVYKLADGKLSIARRCESLPQ